MLNCEQSAAGSGDGDGGTDVAGYSSLRTFLSGTENSVKVQDRLKLPFMTDGGLERTVEGLINQNSKKAIHEILCHVNSLSPLEKLLLYLKLPTGKKLSDPLKQPTNPLGSRSEISLTIAWIKTHLKEDPQTSLPKQDVFNEYTEYCTLNDTKPLSTADFGKVMKQVYPNVRPRRLGTRGNSRYCYSGMATRCALPSPSLPVLPSLDGTVVCRWAAHILGTKEFPNIAALEHHLIEHELAPSTVKSGRPSSFNSENINSNDAAYILDSNICRQEKKQEPEKRKLGKEVPESGRNDDGKVSKKKNTVSGCSSVTGTSGRRLVGSTSKRSSSALDSVSTSTPVTSTSNTHTGLVGVKLPIPRLPKIARATTTSVMCTSSSSGNIGSCVKRQKPLVPKDLLDNGNSLEQEEELLNYFRRPTEEEPKVSQLRMLLEGPKTIEKSSLSIDESSPVKRKMSFDAVSSGRIVKDISNNMVQDVQSDMDFNQIQNAHVLYSISNSILSTSVGTDNAIPGTSSLDSIVHKTFNFVPISPISSSDSSPFLPPKSLMPCSLNTTGTSVSANQSRVRSSSVSEHAQKKDTTVATTKISHSSSPNIVKIGRSQSVPTGPTLPQITPVPSEAIDFDTDSSNLLVMESEDSESLLLENGDNLSHILNLISEMEEGKTNSENTDCMSSLVGASTSLDNPIVSGGEGTFLVPSSLDLPKVVFCSTRSSTPPLDDVDSSTSFHHNLLDGASSLFDDSLSLDCEDTFNSLAREVAEHPNPDTI